MCDFHFKGHFMEGLWDRDPSNKICLNANEFCEVVMSDEIDSSSCDSDEDVDYGGVHGDVFEAIDEVGATVGFPESVLDLAKEIYKKAFVLRIGSRTADDRIAMICTYAACRVQGMNVSLRNFSSDPKTRRKIRRACNKMESKMGLARGNNVKFKCLGNPTSTNAVVPAPSEDKFERMAAAICDKLNASDAEKTRAVERAKYFGTLGTLVSRKEVKTVVAAAVHEALPGVELRKICGASETKARTVKKCVAILLPYSTHVNAEIDTPRR